MYQRQKTLGRPKTLPPQFSAVPLRTFYIFIFFHISMTILFVEYNKPFVTLFSKYIDISAQCLSQALFSSRVSCHRLKNVCHFIGTIKQVVYKDQKQHWPKNFALQDPRPRNLTCLSDVWTLCFQTEGRCLDQFNAFPLTPAASVLASNTYVRLLQKFLFNQSK